MTTKYNPTSQLVIPPSIVDWLTYRSYAFQRKNAPYLEASKWKAIYPDQELYEQIYQSLEEKEEK